MCIRAYHLNLILYFTKVERGDLVAQWVVYSPPISIPDQMRREKVSGNLLMVFSQLIYAVFLHWLKYLSLYDLISVFKAVENPNQSVHLQGMSIINRLSSMAKIPL